MATDSPRIQLRARLITDVGMVRDHNEDFAHIDERMGFFIVADGMGGHAAGEVASRLAVDQVKEHLATHRSLIEEFEKEPNEKTRKALVSELEAAVREAHQSVFDTGAKDPDKQGMGTTLDVVLLAGAEAFVAHVGDSRTYLVRDGKASQLTTDHTVAEVLVIEGKLSLEEAQVSPLRTILVNAIGVAPDVGVEMAHVRLRGGDRLLLCSDGLHDYFPASDELADKIKEGDPAKALEDMVNLAKTRGGHDNITGILVAIDAVPKVNPISEDTEVLEETGVSQKPTEDTVPAGESIAEASTPLPDQPVAKAKSGAPAKSASASGKASIDIGGPTEPDIEPPGEEPAGGPKRRRKNSTLPSSPGGKKNKASAKKDVGEDSGESESKPDSKS